MSEELRSAIAAYDRMYSDKGIRDSDSYYAWIVKLMGLAPGSSVLDVACGEGLFLKYAERSGLSGYGADISSVALEVARSNLDTSRLCQADGERLPFRAGQFDGVACLGSLEHYLHPDKGLQEIRRVLSDDGIAALALPNSYYLVDIVWQVWRTGNPPDNKQELERFATVREWQAFLESGGLRVLRVYKHNFRFPRSAADLRFYRSRPRKILNLLVAPFVPFNLSNSFVFICAKRT
jgi:ubiquinone/menaquinone biosynthesis C-methylase UbiE